MKVMDLLSIVAGIITIAAGLFTILAPFLMDVLKEKSSNITLDNGSNIFNIFLSTNSHTEDNSAKKSTDNVNKIFLYIKEKHQSFKRNVKIIILLSMLTSLLNITLFSLLGSKVLFSSYLEYILNNSYSHQVLAYMVLFATIFIFYFSLSYFFMLFCYEKILEKSIDNYLLESKKSKVEKLSKKIFDDKSISPSNNYPSPLIERVFSNIRIDTNNKIRKSKGISNRESNKNFINSHKLLTPLWIALSINLIFIFFMSDNRGVYYLSKLKAKSVVFTDQYTGITTNIGNNETLKLSPAVVSGTGIPSFNFLRSDGIFYTVDFDSIETVEPVASFNFTAEITTDTHLRYTPYGYNGMTDNSNKPVLHSGDIVRVHKNRSINRDNMKEWEKWILVLTNDGRQGFAYYENMYIYP